MHSDESRFVIGSSNTLSAGMHVCTFQPRNFTGCGSEAVKPTVTTRTNRQPAAVWCEPPLTLQLAAGWRMPRQGQSWVPLGDAPLWCRDPLVAAGPAGCWAASASACDAAESRRQRTPGRRDHSAWDLVILGGKRKVQRTQNLIAQGLRV